MIRDDAAKLPEGSTASLLRLAESLYYEKDQAAYEKVEQMSVKYVTSLKRLADSPDQLAAKKDDTKHLRDAFRYLARFKVIPADFGPKVGLEQIVKQQNWDKEKK